MFPLSWRALRKVGLAYKHTKNVLQGQIQRRKKKMKLPTMWLRAWAIFQKLHHPKKKPKVRFAVFFGFFFASDV
jgi:hypothetical protein